MEFITEDTKVKHTNIKTNYKIIKMESIYMQKQLKCQAEWLGRRD